MSAPNRAERRAWPSKRRAWLSRVAGDRRLTAGCKSWLLLIASRSDDAAKPCWGRQAKMAEALGRCERSVRAYRLEAEQAGYVRTYRTEPQRDPATGRWFRRRSNVYFLTVPAKATLEAPSPRRQQRAGYCVIAAHRAGRQRHQDLPAGERRTTPSEGVRTAVTPPPTISEPDEHPQPTWTGAVTPVVTAALAQARAALVAARARPEALPPALRAPQRA